MILRITNGSGEKGKKTVYGTEYNLRIDPDKIERVLSLDDYPDHYEYPFSKHQMAKIRKHHGQGYDIFLFVKNFKLNFVVSIT